MAATTALSVPAFSACVKSFPSRLPAKQSLIGKPVFHHCMLKAQKVVGSSSPIAEARDKAVHLASTWKSLVRRPSAISTPGKLSNANSFKKLCVDPKTAKRLIEVELEAFGQEESPESILAILLEAHGLSISEGYDISDPRFVVAALYDYGLDRELATGIALSVVDYFVSAEAEPATALFPTPFYSPLKLSKELQKTLQHSLVLVLLAALLSSGNPLSMLSVVGLLNLEAVREG